MKSAPLYGDHIGIVKFNGLNDQNYETVRLFLEDIMTETELVRRKWINWENKKGITYPNHS